MSTKTLISIEEFDRLEESDEHNYELDEGELIIVRKPFPLHNRVAAEAMYRLRQFVEENPIGEVFNSQAMYILGPSTMRAPDASFLRKERADAIEPGKHIDGGPDLAVEVVSPNDTILALRKKIRQYLAAGTRVVWIIHPETREVEIWNDVRSAREVVREDQNLTCELLPGFSVPVAKLFL